MKKITLEFQHVIDYNDVGKPDYNRMVIIARNFEEHRLKIVDRFTGNCVELPISTKYMQSLGAWLIRTANEINADKDLKKQNVNTDKQP